MPFCFYDILFFQLLCFKRQTCVSPSSSELGLSHPLSSKRVCSSPRNQSGWGAHSPAGRGPNSDEETDTLILYVRTVYYNPSTPIPLQLCHPSPIPNTLIMVTMALLLPFLPILGSFCAAGRGFLLISSRRGLRVEEPLRTKGKIRGVLSSIFQALLALSLQFSLAHLTK
jgi:hypothetical protein